MRGWCATTRPPPSGHLGFGEQIPPGEADASIPRPRALGKPDEVYSDEGGVTIVYRARTALPALGDSGIGLLLTRLPGGLETPDIAEARPGGTRLEEVRVDGGRGYWLPDGTRLPSQPGEAERLPPAAPCSGSGRTGRF